MAFENLNPLAAIWKEQGLNYLLFPTDLAGPPVRAPQKAHQTKPVFKRESKKYASPEKEKRQDEKAQEKKIWRPLPVESWPRIWQNQLAKTKKGLVAWTYLKLGEDICSTQKDTDDSLKARREFLRKIIADVAYPAGTHTFWPISLPMDEDGSPRPEIFWSALPILGCRGVVIMGSNTARALFTSASLQPLTQLRINGQFVWILWDIDTLASEERYARVLTFLRQSLKPFSRK